MEKQPETPFEIPAGFTKVTSSAILAVKCDEVAKDSDGVSTITETITVVFPKGVRWRYEGVPRGTFHEMLTAESVGKFFAARVKGKHEAFKEWPPLPA